MKCLSQINSKLEVETVDLGGIVLKRIGKLRILILNDFHTMTTDSKILELGVNDRPTVATNTSMFFISNATRQFHTAYLGAYPNGKVYATYAVDGQVPSSGTSDDWRFFGNLVYTVD